MSVPEGMHDDVKWYGGFAGNEPLTTEGLLSRHPGNNVSGDIHTAQYDQGSGPWSSRGQYTAR